MENKIETSLDWQQVRANLMTMFKDNYEIKQTVTRMDEHIQAISIEEIECRRHKKQTKKHKLLVDEFNKQLYEIEKLATFGALIK